MKLLIRILAILLAILLILLAGLLFISNRNQKAQMEQAPPSTTATQPPTVPTESTAPPTEPAPTEPEPTETEPTEPEPTTPTLVATAVESSDPSNWGVKWSIIENDTVVESFNRETPISFDDNYFALPGLAGFRGDNYRQDGSYGTIDLTNGSIKSLWSKSVGSAASGWNGCGWTGQPPVVQWDAETRAIMNLYEEKKNKENLVEAIYAKMDGYIHFIDMEDGSYTRDPIYIGKVFKGSGALDPRGYPILYLGAGLYQNQNQRIYAISLIDGSILYEQSAYHEKSPRQWFGLDAGPLIDAETDTLLWACESGILFTMKLNTEYDKAAGTISLNPDKPVMGRLTHNYTKNGRNAGFEASITAAQGYVYLADNSGMLVCIDINTMELIWAQDLLDDINATPVFDWEGENAYLYIASSKDYSSKPVPICKIDAQTGEIVWKYEIKCGNDETLSGGAMATPLLGRDGTDMEDIVIFSMASCPKTWYGKVIAFNKVTGEIVWEYQADSYMWSSPIGLYTEDGKGYVFQAFAVGVCHLFDGQTGEIVATYKTGSTTESSPVAFDNHILIGTRSGMNLLEIS